MIRCEFVMHCVILKWCKLSSLDALCNHPGLELRKEVLLPHEPRIMRLPVSTRHFHLKIPQERRDQLVYLQQADVPANARSGPSTKLKHCGLHFSELVWVRFEPSFWAECAGVHTKDLLPSMNHPGVAPYDRPARNVVAHNLNPLGRHHSFQNQAWCRMHAERFLDDGIEIWQLETFTPADFPVSPLSDSTILGGLI